MFKNLFKSTVDVGEEVLDIENEVEQVVEVVKEVRNTKKIIAVILGIVTLIAYSTRCAWTPNKNKRCGGSDGASSQKVYESPDYQRWVRLKDASLTFVKEYYKDNDPLVADQKKLTVLNDMTSDGFPEAMFEYKHEDKKIYQALFWFRGGQVGPVMARKGSEKASPLSTITGSDDNFEYTYKSLNDKNMFVSLKKDKKSGTCTHDAYVWDSENLLFVSASEDLVPLDICNN